MAQKIKAPKIIEAAGSKPKLIEEYIGKVNTSTADISVARMKSPCGWEEPGQTPEFDEYTVVLEGELHIETKGAETIVKEGEAVIAKKGEWIRCSTPGEEGAEYTAVCLPAFSPDTVHRDEA